MAERDIELQRAQALSEAAAALTAEAEAPKERGIGEQVLRGAGLAARAGGPTAAGATLGGGLGLMIGGPALALPGAGAGALSMNIVKIFDTLAGTNYFDKLMDKLGLPKPETPEERVAFAASEGAANMGGMTAAARHLADRAPPVLKGIMDIISQNPGVGISAAASGGGSQEAVKEAGGGPVEQLVGNVVGSMAVPYTASAVGATARGAGRVLRDTVSAAGAGFGHKPSIERLASDAAQTLTKENPEAVRQALKGASTYVEGAEPTVAEAIAEANLKDPTKQVGGAVVKMQGELSGAKGVEDILPSRAKAQEAAIKAHLENLNAKSAELRNMAFESARRAGTTNALSPDLDLRILASKPVYANNQVARSAMRDIHRQLQQVMNPRTRAADPEALYDIRQRVGSTIRAHMEAKRLPIDNKLAAGLEREIQRSIDKAIVDGGAVGWKEYLNLYSKGMQAVEAHQTRAAAAGQIAKGVSPTAPGEVVREELPHIPTLLHRPTMFVNFLLKMIAKDATTPVMRELATRMQDPKAFAELMARPAGAPAQQEVSNILTHAAVLANLIQRHQGEQPASE